MVNKNAGVIVELGGIHVSYTNNNKILGGMENQKSNNFNDQMDPEIEITLKTKSNKEEVVKLSMKAKSGQDMQNNFIESNQISGKSYSQGRTASTPDQQQ